MNRQFKSLGNKFSVLSGLEFNNCSASSLFTSKIETYGKSFSLNLVLVIALDQGSKKLIALAFIIRNNVYPSLLDQSLLYKLVIKSQVVFLLIIDEYLNS